MAMDTKKPERKEMAAHKRFTMVNSFFMA